MFSSFFFSLRGFLISVFEGLIGGPRGSGFLTVLESFMGSRRRLRGERWRKSGWCVRLVRDLYVLRVKWKGVRGRMNDGVGR